MFWFTTSLNPVERSDLWAASKCIHSCVRMKPISENPNEEESYGDQAYILRGSDENSRIESFCP